MFTLISVTEYVVIALGAALLFALVGFRKPVLVLIERIHRYQGLIKCRSVADSHEPQGEVRRVIVRSRDDCRDDFV